jgi:4Fe-4S ferredoxin
MSDEDEGPRSGVASPGARKGTEACKPDTGVLAPVIDRNRCEGKSDCVEVCPYGVFVVEKITDADWSALSFGGKVKSFFHGKKTAYTPNADACRSCGLCVTACPEKAIQLRRPSAPA